MAEKILDSTGAVTTRRYSNLTSIFGNGSLELAWKNGQINVQGGSLSGVTRKSHWYDRYSINPSEANYEDACCTAKSASGPHHSAITGNSYLCTSSTQHCQCSPPLKKPRIIYSSQTPPTNSQKQDLGKVHFSNILTPFIARVEEIKASNNVAKAAATASSSKAPDHSVVIDSSKESPHGLTGFEGLKPSISDAPNWVSFVSRSQETPPDEQSEAVGQYYNQTSSSAGLKAKRKADTNYCDEPLLESSSVCSLGASNNIDFCSRKHDDNDDSTYLSDNDEEADDVVKEKLAQEDTRVKRRRNAKSHSLYERKRRDKINKKMRMLKELIPNCNKMDKASMLDDAIEYLKTLKLQLQIMSMGAGLCMPLMMSLLPNATHHMINTPQFPLLMGFRPGTGISFSLPQFPIAPFTDNAVRMFGFPNQVPPMPISHAPFIPMVGNPSTQPLLATSSATKLAENQASSQLMTTIMASLPNNGKAQTQQSKH